MNSWGNTLAGQRKAKLEAKKLREEREEEIRKKEDIDEAIFKAAERKKAIAHAKTLTFAQTDRVKGFHGALILTEVLKEREAQLQLKGLSSGHFLRPSIHVGGHFSLPLATAAT